MHWNFTRSRRRADAPRAVTSAAASSQATLPIFLNIIPPRWPFVVSVVAFVASVAGGMAAYSAAPIGNRVLLHVEPQAEDAATLVASHAVERELVRQLRAMKLEVGGPDDADHPAVVIHARVDAHPHPNVAFATVASTAIDVQVTDDDAGGYARREFVGFGERQTLSAVRAGEGAAWMLTGDIAALVAPQTTRDSTLRRVTDGRASLRVYARDRADLMTERTQRLLATHAARVPSDETSRALSHPGESARLLGAVDARRALIAVEDRTPVLLATARREPTLLAELEHLELRSADAGERLMSAYHFPGQAAVDSPHGLVAVPVQDGDGTTAICRLDLSTHRRHCRPLGEVAAADAVAILDGGDLIQVRVRDCLSGCANRDLVWHVRANHLREAVPGELATYRHAPLGHWPTGVTWFQWLTPGTAVALVDDGRVVSHRQLTLVHRCSTDVDTLTHAVGDARHPVVSQDGSAVFYEVEHPDPDALANWTEVRRLAL